MYKNILLIINENNNENNKNNTIFVLEMDRWKHQIYY